MSGHIADKKPVGFLMKRGGAPQEARKERTPRPHRNQAAPIFDQKFSGQVGVASLNQSASFVSGKFAQEAVVMIAEAGAFEFSADATQRMENFKQSDIIVTLASHNRQVIVSGGGLLGEMFVCACRREQWS